ncbi:MAG: SH3 domain-containing protein, partial [Planctomycetes bacterium]|nr:SH3 domain-containing protein [Planctomycetota bacterium]
MAGQRKELSMKFTAVILFATAVAFAAAAPTAEAKPARSNTSRAYRVNASSLSVRTGPSLSRTRVGRLSRGAVVSVHRFQAGWAQITYRGARRWVSARYLSRGARAVPR